MASSQPQRFHVSGSLSLPPPTAAINRLGGPERLQVSGGLSLPPPSAAINRAEVPVRSSIPEQQAPAEVVAPVASPALQTPPPSPAAPAATPYGQKVRPWYFKCRFGCQKPLSDEAALRVHMNKTHNLFEDGIEVKECLCGKKFKKDKELELHKQRVTCFAFQAHPLWDIPRPKTAEERADTWAYKKDGPISAKLFVDADGIVLDPPPAVARQTAATTSALLSNKRRRSSGSVDDQERAPKCARTDSGIGLQSQSGASSSRIANPIASRDAVCPHNSLCRDPELGSTGGVAASVPLLDSGDDHLAAKDRDCREAPIVIGDDHGRSDDESGADERAEQQERGPEEGASYGAPIVIGDDVEGSDGSEVVRTDGDGEVPEVRAPAKNEDEVERRLEDALQKFLAERNEEMEDSCSCRNRAVVGRSLCR